MVGPIRFDGPLSGIDFTSIIEASLRFKRLPIQRFERDIAEATTRKNAFLELNVFLLGLKGPVDALAGGKLYASTQVNSSNESALSASGTAVSGLGAFSFTPHRLARSHQLISNGFADADSTALTASATTLSIDLGGGFLRRSTSLDSLNDFAGVDRGAILITDSSGQGALVDLSGALDLQDVLDAINGNTGVSVQASVAGNRLVVKDQAGGAGTLNIQDAGLSTTATDLGLTGTAQPSTPGGSDQFVFGAEILFVTGSTLLSTLNDGLGVRRTSAGVADFRVMMQGNNDFDVDLDANDTTVADVIAKIDAASGGDVTASVAPGGNAIVLESNNNRNIQDIEVLNGSFAAVDLGFGVIDDMAGPDLFRANPAQDSGDGTVGGDEERLVGSALIPTLNSSLTSLLNGGQTNFTLGERRGIADGDITFTDRQGDSAQVTVSRRFATAVAAKGNVNDRKLEVDDISGFAVGNRVRFLNEDGEIEFRTVTAVDFGTNEISFDRALTKDVNNNDGIYAETESVEDVIRLINQQLAGASPSVDVRIEHNSEGNGLRVVDFSGGSGSLIVDNVGSDTVADDLGIKGNTSSSFINGSDLDLQYVGTSTRLASLNAGNGVDPGKIRIVDTNGISFTVDLSQPDDDTMGEVVNEINAIASVFGSGVVARFNDTGDGIVLTDTTPGSGSLQVQEVDNGTTARDLGLLGVAPTSSPATLDGSFEIAIDIEANATLDDIAAAINAEALGVTAAVINDGSSQSPYRLSLTRTRSGADGRFTVSTPISGLSFSTATQGQDAVLLYGGGGSGAEATVITSSTNTVKDLVGGLTLELKSPTATPVTVTVSRDTQAVADEVERFVDSYNDLIQKIREVTAFDVDTFARGVLFSDPGVFRIERTLSRGVTPPVAEIPKADLNHLAEIGITVQSNGTLSLNSSLLQSKLDSDFDQVRSLFNFQRQLDFGTPIEDLNSGLGLTDIAGADFTVTPQDGVSFDVDISGVSTIGGLLSRINNDAVNAGRVTAQISPDGFSLQLIDNSGGSAVPFEVANTGSGKAASELKIAQALPLGKSVLTGGSIGLQGDPGVAARLSEQLDLLTRFGDGLISRKTSTLDDQIEDLEDEIDDQEDLIAKLEQDLILQFSRLEVAIAESQIASQSLGFLLSGLASTGSGGSQGFI